MPLPLSLSAGHRRTGLLLLGVLVLAFGVGLTLVLLTRGPGCSVELTEVESGVPELVPAAELAPEGSVGDERAPVLEAVGGLGGPFGEVVAGRFYAEGTVPPVLVPFGDDVVLADATTEAGEFLAVDVPEGEVRWGRGYAGGAARGGLVGDDFVVLVGGTTPAVVTLDSEDGSREACVAAPVAGESGDVTTLLTDQAATDVIVLAGPPAASVTLSRVAALDGQVRWERELIGLAEAGSVTVVDETAVVARVAADPVRLADMAAAGGIGAPMVTAYALADGADVWSYPAPDRSATTAASVVGSEPGSGVVVVVTAERGGSRSSKATVARLAALDAAGEELWTSRVGTGYWSAALWGDLVVAQGASPSGGPQLRAYSLADGTLRWTIDSSEAPAVGTQPRRNFGGAVAVGEDYVVPAPNGLLLVDPATGAVERLDSQVAVEQVFPAGDHLVVRTAQALLVVERSDGG
jgi:hypothetical protein